MSSGLSLIHNITNHKNYFNEYQQYFQKVSMSPDIPPAETQPAHAQSGLIVYGIQQQDQSTLQGFKI